MGQRGMCVCDSECVCDRKDNAGQRDKGAQKPCLIAWLTSRPLGKRPQITEWARRLTVP